MSDTQYPRPVYAVGEETLGLLDDLDEARFMLIPVTTADDLPPLSPLTLTLGTLKSLQGDDELREALHSRVCGTAGIILLLPGGSGLGAFRRRSKLGHNIDRTIAYDGGDEAQRLLWDYNCERIYMSPWSSLVPLAAGMAAYKLEVEPEELQPDDVLAFVEDEGLRAHLAECEGCRDEFEQYCLQLGQLRSSRTVEIMVGPFDSDEMSAMGGLGSMFSRSGNPFDLDDEMGGLGSMFGQRRSRDPFSSGIGVEELLGSLYSSYGFGRRRSRSPFSSGLGSDLFGLGGLGSLAGLDAFISVMTRRISSLPAEQKLALGEKLRSRGVTADHLRTAGLDPVEFGYTNETTDQPVEGAGE